MRAPAGLRPALVVPALVVLALAAARPAACEAPAIDHDGVGCAVAEKFPRLQARIVPADAVARALVHFRTDAAQPWYAVAMKSDGGWFSGVLPKPKGSLKAFQYYIDVTDRAFATARTPEYTTTVVSGPGACGGKMMAGALGSASILLEIPAGAPLVPVGFGSAGVAAAGSGTAAASATAGAAGGGGAGIGTVAAIVGGGAAVAGAVVAVKAASGDDDGSGESGSGPQPAAYDVNIPLPGLDLSPCGRAVRWSSQTVNVDGSGRFDTTWSPNEPNTLRVTGTLTATTFNATLNCVSGSGSGSMSATGGGGTYQGTFNFAGQSGSITVVRKAL